MIEYYDELSESKDPKPVIENDTGVIMTDVEIMAVDETPIEELVIKTIMGKRLLELMPEKETSQQIRWWRKQGEKQALAPQPVVFTTHRSDVGLSTATRSPHRGITPPIRRGHY